MSLSVTFNGSMFIIPETGEVGWGGNVSSYLVAIAAGALQKTGGSFTLSAETDFGASFGVKSLYYKSRTTNPASAEEIRLASGDAIAWRNFANSGNLLLTTDASDRLLYNGSIILTNGGTGFVTSITGTANQVIASSPDGAVTLSLPQSIATSSDVQFGTLALGAALDASSILSLSSITKGFLPPRMTTVQRDAIVSPSTGLTIYNTNTSQINYYNGASWIALAAGGAGTVGAGLSNQLAYYPVNGTIISGLTSITAAKALISDSNGLPIASTTTAAEIAFVSGVTSAIQTQLNTKAPLANPAFTGNVSIGQPSPVSIFDVESTSSEVRFTLKNQTTQDLIGFDLLSEHGGTPQRWIVGSNVANSDGSYEFRNQTTGANILELTSVAKFPSGSAANPSIAFISDINTGIYNAAADLLAFSTAGTLAVQIDGSQNLQISDGTVSAPGLRFINDSNTGLYRATTDRVNITAGGTDVASFLTSAGTALANFPDGLLAAPGIGFLNDTDTGLYRIGTNNFGGVCGGTKVLDASTAGVAILGTNTNNSAASGFVGEFISSTIGATSISSSSVVQDLTSISLTAGDWDISINIYFVRNTATWSAVEGFIGTVSGNNFTGYRAGDNAVDAGWTNSATTPTGISLSAPSYRVSLASTTIHYLKVAASFSAGTPQVAGARISARRVR